MNIAAVLYASGRDVRVVGLLVLSVFVYLLHSHAFLAATERVHYTEIPINAEDILGKCAALSVRPGPPETFYKRMRSDRFQEGTKQLLIRNATLWTGRVQGMEVVKGDLLLDWGLIVAVGEVAEGLLRDDRSTVDANGCVSFWS